MSRAIVAAIRGDCPFAAMTTPEDVEDRLRSGATSETGPTGQIAWIVPGRLYLEQTGDYGKQYFIREYEWTFDGEQVFLRHAYSTVYRRPSTNAVATRAPR